MLRTDSLFKGFTQDGGYTTNYLEVGGNQNDVGLIYSFGQTLANIPVRLSLSFFCQVCTDRVT